MIRSKVAPGLTLVEVLVAISVIGLLLALLVPAVQSAREASRRVQCLQNLRQIGTALQNYQAANGVYPCTMPVNNPLSGGIGGGGRLYSPFVKLLPHAEQAALFNSINFLSEDFSLWANDTVLHARIELFLCPSDGAPAVRRFGPVSYRVNTGPSVNPRVPDLPSGGLDHWQWVTPSDFLDGLSTTVAMSEKVIGDLGTSRVNRFTQHIYPVPGPQPNTPSYSDVAAMNCRNADPALFEIHADGSASWFLNGFGHTWYVHTVGPNPEFLDCNFHRPFAGGLLAVGVFAARSYHPGGVNVLMMDGSTRFTQDGIDLALWRALSTRAGGEAIDSTF
jgi:prepilin-type N-terminal cleavage/methylation domain-containing protein/prepilin-type processing-associated H-X9-DG protein